MRIELEWIAIGFFKWKLVVDRVEWFDPFGSEHFFRITGKKDAGNDEGALK